MQTKQTLSVVLATFQEQDNIKDCLLSVKNIADEIIVVDESSTDKTKEIATSLGAKVITTIHEPIFHITKNKAIVAAKCDWILQLDADERVTPTLAKEITSILSGRYFGYDSWLSPLKTKLNRIFPLFSSPKLLPKPASAYWIPRKNFFLKGYLHHTGQYPDPVIRFFQKGKAILPAEDVHEQMRVDGTIGWLKSDLDHYANPRFGRYLLRENRYSSLSAHQLYSQRFAINPVNTINYLLLKPFLTFSKLYFRHRGFLDGFPGFVFSLFSGLHFAFSYMKLWELYKAEKNDKS